MTVVRRDRRRSDGRAVGVPKPTEEPATATLTVEILKFFAARP